MKRKASEKVVLKEGDSLIRVVFHQGPPYWFLMLCPAWTEVSVIFKLTAFLHVCEHTQCNTIQYNTVVLSQWGKFSFTLQIYKPNFTLQKDGPGGTKIITSVTPLPPPPQHTLKKRHTHTHIPTPRILMIQNLAPCLIPCFH